MIAGFNTSRRLTMLSRRDDNSIRTGSLLNQRTACRLQVLPETNRRNPQQFCLDDTPTPTKSYSFHPSMEHDRRTPTP